MKAVALIAAGLALAAPLSAFPTALFDSPESDFRQFLAGLAEPNSKRAILADRGAKSPKFNATAQHVSILGNHTFIPPGPDDDRGPCPGLNALANHGYLPRNGRATIQQLVTGTFEGFGMASDLAHLLAYYGALLDGDGKGWSIGGLPHTGMSGAHNNYETDSSPLKADLFQYGWNGKLVVSQFYALYNMQPDPATANYDLDVLRDFRHTRFQESIQKNPYYFYGPFTGIGVSQAAFIFIARFMGNKSAEAPEGILNKDTLKTFMSMSGPEDNLTWTFGHERFPENFYKRAIGDEFTISGLGGDIVHYAQKYPEIISVGCNTGTTNSYLSIPPQNLTNEVMTLAKVAENPLCYALQMTNAKVLAGKSGLLGLNNLLAKALTALGLACSAIPNPDLNVLHSLCPGARAAYGGPTADVAPGAIMS